MSNWKLLSSLALIAELSLSLTGCGSNTKQTTHSIFDPMLTLTANIALEMAYALGNHRGALFVSGLVLMAAIIILTIASELIGNE